MEAFKSVATDVVKPFKDVEDPEEEEENVACIGPCHVGWCVIEIHGAVQIVFMVIGFAALAFLIIEIYRGADTWRLVGGVIFVLVCAYLVWLGKAIYLVKAFRKEIEKLKELKQQLRGEVEKLEEQNEEYDTKNKAQEVMNQQLTAKIRDLSRVQKQLVVLSGECQGNTEQARQLLNRLERNLKLDTVNSVLLFFDRADKEKTGKVEGSNIAFFVDNLGFLWHDLPEFNPEHVKAAIARQGGINLEQIQQLVESVMPPDAEEEEDPQALTHRLEAAIGGPLQEVLE